MDTTQKVADVLASKEQLKHILDASPIGVSISRYYDGKIVYVNSTLAQMWGKPAKDMLGSDSVNYYHDQDDIRWVIQELSQHRPVKNYDMLMNRADGSFFWTQINMIAIWIEDIRFILSWFNDVSEIRRVQEQLKQMATQDFLTGLANRMRFNEFMTEVMARCWRSNKIGSLFYLDLDGFKDANDKYGHHMGDFVLQQVAHRMTSTLRETDFVARLGGDEFAVVIEPLTDSIQSEKIAQKILDIIQQPYENQGKSIIIGVSIGIAQFGPESRDADEILHNADSAMYQAKGSGKGRINIYNAQNKTLNN